MGSYTTIEIFGPKEELEKIKLHKLPDFEIYDGYDWDLDQIMEYPHGEPPRGTGIWRVWTAGSSRWSPDGTAEWAQKFTTKRPTLRIVVREEWDNRDADEPGSEESVYEGGQWLASESKVSGEVPADLVDRLSRARKLLDEYENAYPSQDAAVLAEVRATGPIIEAFRDLIGALS